jgi:hypothetical protein
MNLSKSETDRIFARLVRAISERPGAAKAPNFTGRSGSVNWTSDLSTVLQLFVP